MPLGPRGAGEVRLATDGRPPNFPGVSAEAGLPKDCSNGLGSREKCELLEKELVSGDIHGRAGMNALVEGFEEGYSRL